MKKVLWILMTAGLLFGCKPGIPADIIRADKMEKILYDIHLADGYISSIPYSDSAKVTAASYYKGIYKKFDIDSAIYTKSMDYYYAHPEKLSLIYKNIDVNLKSQLAVFNRIDSIKNAKRINAENLVIERKADSVLINQGYSMENATKSLYLKRFNDIRSKNGILFNILKIKKDTTSVKNVKDATKKLSDTLKNNKSKIELQVLPLPLEAQPVEIE